MRGFGLRRGWHHQLQGEQIQIVPPRDGGGEGVAARARQGRGAEHVGARPYGPGFGLPGIGLAGVEFQLEAGADTRLQLAQDNLALADKAWRLGERPLESLLRTRSAFFDAEEARLRARHARAQAETAQLYWSGVAE